MASGGLIRGGWHVVTTAIAGTLLAACATTSAPEHQSQIDPATNFIAYDTFGWKAPAAQDTNDQPMRMLDVNIRSAIEAELTRRGYQKTDTNPQFLVTYETAAAEKVKSNPFRIGIGVGSYGSSGGGSVSVGSPSVKNYREGRLVIHAIDAAANKEVWFGTVSGSISNQGLDADSVARAVAIAMQDFPSKASAP
jgi:hypothetical protein